MLTVSLKVMTNAAYERALRFYDRASGDPIDMSGDTYTLKIGREDGRGGVTTTVIPYADPAVIEGNRFVFAMAKVTCALFVPGEKYVGQVIRDSDDMLVMRVALEAERGVE